MTARNADLELLHEAKAALDREDREGALRHLSDLSVFDGPTMTAMSAAFDGDLASAKDACERATEARSLSLAV